MKIKATGQKDKCTVSLVYVADSIVPFRVECDDDSTWNTHCDQWMDEVFDLSQTDLSFSGELSVPNTSTVKLLWIIDGFFDEKPKIESDVELADEEDENDDEQIVY